MLAPGVIPQTGPAGAALGPAGGALLVAAAAVLAHVWIERTGSGLEVRAVGLDPRAALFAGIRPGPRLVAALGAGGAAAGLAGAVQVLGPFGRYVECFSPGYGYAGIAVAMVAGQRPLPVIPVALLFGVVRSGTFAMDLLEVAPRETAGIVEAVVLLAAASAAALRPGGASAGRGAAA